MRRLGKVATAGALVLCLSAEPAMAQYGPVDRPDALIRQGKWNSFVGGGVYGNNGANQRVEARVRRGQAARFQIRLRNNGAVSDGIRVRAPGSSRHYRVRYFFNGRNVTQLVITGRFVVRNLPPGAARGLSMTVTPKRSAPARQKRVVNVRTNSTNDPTQVDTVRTRVSPLLGPRRSRG